MLNWSGNPITIDKSKDYIKLTCIIHLLTLFLIYRSAFDLTIVFTLCFLVGIHFILFIQNHVLVNRDYQLIHIEKKWIMIDNDAQEIEFERMSFVFNGGFFFVIKLHREHQIKRLMVFNDQIKLMDLKKIHMIGQLQNEIHKKTSRKKLSVFFQKRPPTPSS